MFTTIFATYNSMIKLRPILYQLPSDWFSKLPPTTGTTFYGVRCSAGNCFGHALKYRQRLKQWFLTFLILRPPYKFTKISFPSLNQCLGEFFFCEAYKSIMQNNYNILYKYTIYNYLLLLFHNFKNMLEINLQSNNIKYKKKLFNIKTKMLI